MCEQQQQQQHCNIIDEDWTMRAVVVVVVVVVAQLAEWSHPTPEILGLNPIIIYFFIKYVRKD